MNLKTTLRTHLINLFGKTTPKIVVIESDDWGSIRMPNKEIYSSLARQGFDFSDQPYERVDSIATEDDLTALFQVLSKYKDQYGNHPVFTALSVSANPSFKKIKESGFEKYHYVTLDVTLQEYSRKGNLKSLWEEGIRNKVFFPQFHGREHLNVCQWLRDLRTKDNDNRMAFEMGIPGFFERSCPEKGNIYAKALKVYRTEDSDFIKQSIKDGLGLFESLWGYKSHSMMAPAYTWNRDVEKEALECGVNYIQTAYYQNFTINNGNIKVIRHYFGQSNRLGQHYLLRNCYFEPIQNNYSNVIIDSCLKQIEIAFKYHKPATISSHRLNYIGRIDVSNRDKSLRLLDTLLYEIVKRWPDVLFMNSVSVGELIK